MNWYSRTIPYQNWISGTGSSVAEVFSPLEDVKFFSGVTVDQEAGTIVWPNGVDFCPDVLYAEATGKAISEMGTNLELV